MTPDLASPPITDAAQRAALGAYGLRIEGLDAAGMFAEVAAGAPRLEITVEQGTVSDRAERFSPREAEISLLDGGWVSLDRGGVTRFTLPRRVADEEIVHPWLVPAAATYNGWLGRQVLHGGAFAVGDRAVAVLGAKEDGKSSLLAWLAQTYATEVLVDDLAVIDAGRIYAGPRCIDLRPGSAGAIAGVGGRLVRDAGRIRLGLKPCRGSAQLEAIVVLGWSEAIAMAELAPFDGLSALLPHTLNGGASANLLDLLGIPVWSLTRPRTWETMPAVTEALMGLIEQPSVTGGAGRPVSDSADQKY